MVQRWEGAAAALLSVVLLQLAGPQGAHALSVGRYRLDLDSLTGGNIDLDPSVYVQHLPMMLNNEVASTGKVGCLGEAEEKILSISAFPARLHVFRYRQYIRSKAPRFSRVRVPSPFWFFYDPNDPLIEASADVWVKIT
jgi:hypothetical protein